MNEHEGGEAERLPSTSAEDNYGGFADGWFHEQHRGVTRQAIRVAEHLHVEHSRFQKIDVYQSPFLGRFLTLDDLMMLTERDEFVYHEMLTHVPLCSIPEPKSVLVIGGGDCGCVREAIKHPSLEKIVQCEIDERVTRVCEDWFDWVRPTLADPRVEFVFDDGIPYIEQHEASFDLIIIDSTDPVGPAEGLFRREFYAKVARALKPGGVMAAQTESPHWDDDLVGRIFAQVRGAFALVAPYIGFIPTYPSGMWSWAYASNDRRSQDSFDRARAEALAATCRYYQPELQKAAFALPRFAQQAVDGERPFERWDEISS